MFGMDIQQAIDEPRIYSSHPNRIEWEPQFSQSTILALIAHGHAMEHKQMLILEMYMDYRLTQQRMKLRVEVMILEKAP
ncbi:Gamma-glutamyltranspeptidase [Staphylococcus aureus]|uniref:Gamma-glutamyltranspeptidase n=1 Tax=Staphylococcus aureus TaxID=1280 RepID=A0A380EDM8_STAAU|nr:Gamma-glutamyltranspeptidase [Staphylococcus aureus]